MSWIRVKFRYRVRRSSRRPKRIPRNRGLLNTPLLWNHLDESVDDGGNGPAKATGRHFGELCSSSRGTRETLLAGGEEGNEAGKKKLLDSRTITLHTWTFGEVQPAPKIEPTAILGLEWPYQRELRSISLFSSRWRVPSDSGAAPEALIDLPRNYLRSSNSGLPLEKSRVGKVGSSLSWKRVINVWDVPTLKKDLGFASSKTIAV